MNRRDVLQRLCAVVTKVGATKFHSAIPHDCFCHEGGAHKFQFVDDKVIEFIEAAVAEKLARG